MTTPSGLDDRNEYADAYAKLYGALHQAADEHASAVLSMDGDPVANLRANGLPRLADWLAARTTA